MELFDKFNIINLDQYFIDYIKVNWQIPLNELSWSESDKAKKFHKHIFAVLKKKKLIWSENNKYINGILPLIDKHYNIQVDFKGSFFKYSKHYKKDFKRFYKWFKEIDFIIQFHWDDFEIGFKHPRATISRLDLANHSFGSHFKDYTAIMGPRKIDDVTVYNTNFEDGFYTTGVTIAPKQGRKTDNIFFRAYDKRFATNSQLTCLERFKSIDLIRREWMLKSRFLRRNLICTPEDLYATIINNKKMTEIIKKMRKSKDLILPKDNKLYKSLHDERARELIHQGTDLNLKEFKKIFNSRYDIFVNKATKNDIKKLKWNPFKNMVGLMNHGENMSSDEYYQLLRLIIDRKMKMKFDEYNFKDEQDIHMDKLNIMLQVLDEIHYTGEKFKV